MAQTKLKELSYKLKNVIRLFQATKNHITDQKTRLVLKEYISEARSLKSNPELWERQKIELMLLRLHPVMEGKEITDSISLIQGHKYDSSSNSVPIIGENPSSSLMIDKSDNKQPSEISEDTKGLLDSVNLFFKANERRIMSTILINKNLPDQIDSKDSMFVIGCSESKDNKTVVLCGVMKYSDQQLIDLSSDQRDLVCFMNAQRVPTAVAKIMAQNEELDYNFLRSITQIKCHLNMGMIKIGNKISMFQITPEGVNQLNSCPKEGQHKVKWPQKTTKFLQFFDDKQVNKCFIQPSAIQTKYIKRNCQKNNVIKVQDCIQLSEKIQAKNYNYKFAQKFYATIKWNKTVYLVLIPNEHGVLDKFQRFDRMEDVEGKYRDQRVVVLTRTKDVIPADFSKLLLKMKEAVAGAVWIKATGNQFLLYKLTPQATENKIIDTPWDDIENGKQNAIYEKIFMYSKNKAKEYQSKVTPVCTEI